MREGLLSPAPVGNGGLGNLGGVGQLPTIGRGQHVLSQLALFAGAPTPLLAGVAEALFELEQAPGHVLTPVL